MTETVSHSDSLNAEQEGYHQSLGRRQVQMIAIGGAIGTGLSSARPPGCTTPARRWSSAMPRSV
jgi:L-asparagine permease